MRKNNHIALRLMSKSLLAVAFLGIWPVLSSWAADEVTRISLPQESALGLTKSPAPEDYVWTSPSKNSSESMPLGGGDVGANVWVEDGDILFYLSRSGAFDENNTLLKLGRFRLHLNPSPFVSDANDFEQRLSLHEGYMSIKAAGTEVQLWVDVFHPVLHVEVSSRNKVSVDIAYENWRTSDVPLTKAEGQQSSYKWIVPKQTKTRRDSIDAQPSRLYFGHRNAEQTVFDFVVAQQQLSAYKDSLYNPLAHRTFGGSLSAEGMYYTHVEQLSDVHGRSYSAWHYATKQPVSRQHIQVAMHIDNAETWTSWKKELDQISNGVRLKKDRTASRTWWRNYWQRSHITTGTTAPDSLRAALRHYALFRYMLGCNAYSAWPTKFNGSLFTFDPVGVDAKSSFTPDYRRWGGGTHTAQNQRLVYWGMLKSGDFDMMPAQLDYYLRLLPTAELRSRHYWGHEGACFTEQIENFGLPNPAEYGTKRPAGFDPGLEYNAWLEYEWDTALEFCQMALDMHRYAGINIDRYEPLIISVLTFFDEHYRMLARQRGRKDLNAEGHLVLYPGSACETYKMTYDASSTVAALRRVTTDYLTYRHQRYSVESDSLFAQTPIATLLQRIPPVPTRVLDGHTMIAPARLWERVNNTETPQLYPVFPWRLYGVASDSLDIAINTYLYDPDALKFRSHVGWKQDNIWAACLGLTDEAARLTMAKLAHGPHRFPAFWGPGFDWTPDHNWGGSAMIGLQEMLVQERDGKILLFPAWPKTWDVDFKLHLLDSTTISVSLQDGQVSRLEVFPASRLKDVVSLLK